MKTGMMEPPRGELKHTSSHLQNLDLLGLNSTKSHLKFEKKIYSPHRLPSRSESRSRTQSPPVAPSRALEIFFHTALVLRRTKLRNRRSIANFCRLHPTLFSRLERAILLFCALS